MIIIMKENMTMCNNDNDVMVIIMMKWKWRKKLFEIWRKMKKNKSKKAWKRNEEENDMKHEEMKECIK